MRSHGGRVRAIESGEVHIDIAFIGAPTCDEYGNMRANGGKSDCGVLSYAMVDAQYADKVVADDRLPRSVPEHSGKHLHGRCGLRLCRR